MRTARLIPAVLALVLCVAPGTAQNNTVIAIALEGGGARGIAHVGVLQVLEELGIQADMVTGNSMGAIVGGLYSIGYDSKDLAELVLGMDWPGLFSEPSSNENVSWSGRHNRALYAARIPFTRKGLALGAGLLDGNVALAQLDRLTIGVPSNTHFDSFNRKFRAVASDIINGESVILESGSLAEAIRASMSVPGVFEPYSINGRYLVDGLVLDNLPIDAARSMNPDIVIAVHLVDNEPVTPETLGKNPVQILRKTLDTFTDTNVKRQLPNADIVIAVDITGLGTNDFLKAEELIYRGKTAAYAMRDILKPLASGSVPPARELPERLETLSISGGTTADRNLIRETLETSRGVTVDKKTLEELYHLLMQKNRYEQIRMQQFRNGDQRELVVTLTDRTYPGHEIHAGFFHEGTYFSDMATATAFTTGVTFRGLTGLFSELTVNTGFNGTMLTNAAYRQPLKEGLFIEPFFSWQTDSTASLYDTETDTQTETNNLSFGLLVRQALCSGSDLSFGWVQSRLDPSSLPDIPGSGELYTVSLFQAGLRMNLLDSVLFPMRGFSLDAVYRVALELPDSGDFFQVLSVSGMSILPFLGDYSLAFLWHAATDFTPSGEDAPASPLYYRPGLMDRRLFPGPLPLSARFGHTAAGLGVEVKRQWALASAFFSLPVFAFGAVSTGFTAEQRDDFTTIHENLVYSFSIGIGSRINEAFGISFRGGASLNTGDNPIPFFSVDIGSVIR